MKETKSEMPTKQEVFMDYINYYEANWVKGKFIICNEEPVKVKAKELLDSVSKSVERFSSFDFYNIASDCAKLKKEEDTVFGSLAKAFQGLELICVNLFLSPWKKEIKTLKTFTGYFVYFIQPVLPEDIIKAILEKLGYTQKTTTEFVITGKINEETTKQIAFDIFLARMECETLLKITSEDKSYDCLHVLQRRSQITLINENMQDGKRSQLQQVSMTSTDEGTRENQSCSAKDQGLLSQEMLLDTDFTSENRLECFSEKESSVLMPAPTDQYLDMKDQDTNCSGYYGTLNEKVDLYSAYPSLQFSQIFACPENPLHKESKRLPVQPDSKVQLNDSKAVLDSLSTLNENDPSARAGGAQSITNFLKVALDLEGNKGKDKKGTKEPSSDLVGGFIRTEDQTISESNTSNNVNPLRKENVPTVNNNLIIENLTEDQDVTSNLASAFNRLNLIESTEENVKHPVEETAQPALEMYVSPMNFKESQYCNNYLSSTSALAPSLTQVAPKICKPSPNLMCNVPECNECSHTDKKTQKVLTEAHACQSSSEGLTHNMVREPPHSIYIPPCSPETQPLSMENYTESNSVTFNLCHQPQFKENYFENSALTMNSMLVEGVRVNMKEDHTEDFIIISKDAKLNQS
ncbi:uncharacterized protein SI:CH211-189A15.5 [Latimeria chalumnae]|uniref:uncharacterized protein SI:CH211-189A15.5 n=1 Tax=Latimeria chalumnae TaxID=7897 RepID=UPI0003C11651|nr:PREDICTED: uncharacterized protein LOC102359712 [Latimeria chalumnae]|eukprot:XP_006003979.1 PREDICTED: uncharacterized protein LOC102359712 [Latimeria chalumnae]